MASAERLPRSTPEAVGIPSQAIMDFVHALEQHRHPLDAVHSFMLLRHGKVAAEGWWAPYGPDLPHILYSLSKSFTSTAIGLAVAEGRLSVDDPVLTFFPADAPADPSPNLRAMCVRHLLAMNTGHHADTTDAVFGCGHADWPRAFLALPVEHEPGARFVYNTAATYMLSAIITQLTGETLLEYLRPRLFAPLGIEHPTWEADPRGINLGGTGLHIRTEDIACFGQMYLQHGMWEGKQIVPSAWIAEATRIHSDNGDPASGSDWTQGYGYQFWRCRHDAYRGDGAFGQFCVVLPEQGAVLAITSGVRDMQAVLDKVWKHLLPAMGAAPLPLDSEAHGALCAKLYGLALPCVEGLAGVGTGAQWGGKVYRLEHNDLGLTAVAVESGKEGEALADGDVLVLCDQWGEHRVPLGHGAWRKGSSNLRGRGEEPVAASGGWTADDRYEARLCLYASELAYVLRLHFSEDDLRLEVEPNVSWVEPKVTAIAGHAAVPIA
jgi:CubicO group peptidase (beta-lactamase class C family)